MTDATDPYITDFAAHLVPEAFSMASTANRAELMPRSDHGDAFSHWVEQCRRDAVTADYPPRGVARAVSGMDRVLGDKIVSTIPLGDAQEFVRAAKRVLRGHASRRTYRLR